MILSKKDSHDTTRKGTPISGAPIPPPLIHDSPVGQEDSVSVKRNRQEFRSMRVVLQEIRP